LNTLCEAARRALQVSPDDNVATLLARAEVGEEVRVQGPAAGPRLEALSAIPFGHKIALVDIAAGQQVVKYGQRIGRATADIPRGDHAHVHNVVGERGRKDKQRLEDDRDGAIVGGGDHC